jgi:hypothetical protein
MEIIPASKEMAAAAHEVALKTVIPSWAKRTGPEASAIFNQYIAPYSGFTIP